MVLFLQPRRLFESLRHVRCNPSPVMCSNNVPVSRDCIVTCTPTSLRSDLCQFLAAVLVCRIVAKWLITHGSSVIANYAFVQCVPMRVEAAAMPLPQNFLDQQPVSLATLVASLGSLAGLVQSQQTVVPGVVFSQRADLPCFSIK